MFTVTYAVMLTMLLFIMMTGFVLPLDAQPSKHHHRRHHFVHQHRLTAAPAPVQQPCFLFFCLSPPVLAAPVATEHVTSRRHRPAQAHRTVRAAREDKCVFLGCLGRVAASTGRAGVAVYNIMAHAITLPDGTTLEAHSGFGAHIDDPSYAHVRMQGPTPPHEYELTPRESLFHGVAALRLNPVGGSAAIHGRSGLLAHSYMAGGRGDSNGCVSIKDYQTFLQAYRRGEFRRLVVVAGAA